MGSLSVKVFSLEDALASGDGAARDMTWPSIGSQASLGGAGSSVMPSVQVAQVRPSFAGGRIGSVSEALPAPNEPPPSAASALAMRARAAAAAARLAAVDAAEQAALEEEEEELVNLERQIQASRRGKSLLQFEGTFEEAAAPITSLINVAAGGVGAPVGWIKAAAGAAKDGVSAALDASFHANDDPHVSRVADDPLPHY